MKLLKCTVEMYSKPADRLISGEFSASSVFEAAWIALCTWAGNWYFDPDAIVAVKCGDQSWQVTQKRIRAWRPIVRLDEALRQLHKARTDED